VTSRAILAAVVVLALVACGGETTPPSRPPATAPPSHLPGTPAALELTIFAAASLKSVLDEVKAEYEAANPGTTLTISTDSSAALETKIEQGAPADVFMSADTTNPQKLIDRGFATEPLVEFAGNRLTIIVPADNPAGIERPADLARGGVDIIAAGDEVPITKYAGQLVRNLAGQPGYPGGFEAAYAANVVSKEENVKAIVGKIELGQGDAGIVYVTDAAGVPNIRTIEVPDAANVLATYAGVLVKASSSEAEGRAFLAWLAGSSGQAVLAHFGFLPPPS
jgi:molybdate transport system substrate-binding protein